MVWFCVCVAPLGDWVNGGCINVLVPKCGKFTLGKCDFSSLGSSSYSRKWVWNLRTKFCCITTGKGNVSRVTLQEFDDNKYLIF